MAEIFSDEDATDDTLGAEEIAPGSIFITIEKSDVPHSISVDAEELARALLTASPAFSKAIGDIVRDAMRKIIAEHS